MNTALYIQLYFASRHHPIYGAHNRRLCRFYLNALRKERTL